MKNFFTRSHLYITRAMHDLHNKKYAASSSLSMDEAIPNYALFKLFLDRVGSPWDWPLRSTYKNDLTYWQRMLEAPDTRLFILRRDSMPIGFCHIGALRAEGQKVVSGHIKDTKACIEIKHFGFFVEETGKGYGRYFLPKLFDILFQKYDTIYLSTRDTNHDRVIPFYESLGMNRFHSEALPSDLVMDTRVQNHAA